MSERKIKKFDLRLRCACGAWARVRGESDVAFTAEALGWVPHDDGTWTCPDCARKGDLP